MKKIIFLFCTCFLMMQAFAQLSPQVDSIPMSDGRKLAADIYIPAGCSSCPAILIQTPYNRLLYHFGLPLGIGFNQNSSNYVFVIVDWRCFYGSSAACVANPDRGQDGYDVIQWITTQTWSNGKVGTWGPSALGVIQFQTAKKHPPGLICSVPLVASPVTSYFDYYPNGVLRTEYVQQLAALGYSTTAILAFPFYNAGWQLSETNSNYPDSIAVPMLMIGGWYDHNTISLVNFFNEIRQQSPVAVRNKHRLVMGPWTHNTTSGSPANIGQLSYPQAQGWSDSLALAFLDYHLRNISNGWNNTPYVNYFQMGDNAWQSDTAWPPQTLTAKLYMHGSAVLDFNAPVLSADNTGLMYDPHNPSPTIGGATLRSDLQQGPYDQAPVVENRTDLLKFTTSTLTQHIRVKGRPKVHLHVSSDKLDTDFSIRLTDVYPDNTSMLLSDGIFRMRFRNGFTTADTASMIPGQIYSIVLELPDVAVTFPSGHKIRVDVSSSNYPLYDCNLNNGMQMYVAGDTMIASQTIYFDNSHDSYLELPIADSTVRVNEISTVENSTVEVYPNPASGIVDVVSKNGLIQKMELFDSSGNKIFILNDLQQSMTRIDLSNYSRGVYSLKVYSEKNIVVKKIVVID